MSTPSAESDDGDPDTSASLGPLEDSLESGLPAAEAEATGPDDLNENFIPGNSPITRLQRANTILRRWVVLGLGGLLIWVLGLAPLIVLLRPELVQFATSYTQIAVGSLMGVSASVVGFLFAREQGRE